MFLVDPSQSQTASANKTKTKKSIWWPFVVLMFMDPSVVEPAIAMAMKGAVADPRKYLEKIIQVCD